MEDKKTNMLNLMPQQEMIGVDDKNWALFAHIGTFVGGLFVPLIIWLTKKDESPFVSEHAKESLNFQISLMLYLMIGVILSLIIVGIFIILALTVFSIWVTIKATIEASNGRSYHYPLCIKIVQ